MKGYRAVIAVLGAGVASLFLTTHVALAADTQPRLRLIATDASARAVVVKLDDDKPVLWHQGETFAMAKHVLRLLQCTHDHAVAEIVGPSGVGKPQLVMLSVGQSYAVDEAPILPAERLAAPIATGRKPG